MDRSADGCVDGGGRHDYADFDAQPFCRAFSNHSDIAFDDINVRNFKVNELRYTQTA